MTTAVHPGNHFHIDIEDTAPAMSFDPESREPQSMLINLFEQAAADAPRRRHLKVVGRPIEVAFGQVDILSKLDKRTLEGMASDPNTPVVVLERLAAHPIADVRVAVSENENTPLYTIWALSKDGDADVRYQLAENHNLPLALIRSLTNDENPYVACRAQQTYDRQTAR